MVNNLNKILCLLLVLLLFPITVSAIGNISVSSSPSGALVYIDGITIGTTTPVIIESVTSGSHIVLLRLTGYQDYPQSVMVSDNAISTVSATLTTTTTTIATTTAITTITTTANAPWPSLEIIPNQATFPSGTHVTVRSEIWVDSFPSNNKLQLFTELDNPAWTYNLVVNSITNVRPVNTANTWYISGFELSYKPTDSVSVRIGLDGTTPATSTQVSKKIISIQETDSSNNFIISSKLLIERLVGTPTPTPTPSVGSLIISSVPSGANIFIDNAYKGLTPLTIDNLQNGNQIVLIKLNGYQDWSRNVVVMANSQTIGASLITSSDTSASQSATATIVQTSKPTVVTTMSPSPSIRTAITTPISTSKVTVKNPTPWPTDTPTQPSPLGIELGIIATIGAIILVMKWK